MFFFVGVACFQTEAPPFNNTLITKLCFLFFFFLSVTNHSVYLQYDHQKVGGAYFPSKATVSAFLYSEHSDTLLPFLLFFRSSPFFKIFK